MFEGYLLNHVLAPYMGYPLEAYFTGQACSGISFFWNRWPRIFLPGHMGGGLVLGLTVISVEGSMSNSFRLYVG